MYFERTDTVTPPLAQAAIDVVVHERDLYERWSNQSIVSDELALLVAANRDRADMPSAPDFVDAINLRQAGRIRFRVVGSVYHWPERPWGEQIDDVAILHFCSSAKLAATYAREIHRLTGLRQRADVGLKGVLRRCRHDVRRWLSRAGV